MATSYNGTIVLNASGSITDASGNTWSLIQTPNQGLRVTVNGSVDPTTFFVTKLEYYNGQVYQENITVSRC